MALGLVPVGIDFVQDLDTLVLGKDLPVTFHPHLVGRVSGHTVDGDHLALAVQGRGKPSGGLHGPTLLVDTHVDGIFGRHLGIRGDNDNPLPFGLSKHRIKGGGAVGIDNNGVDALVDKVAHMGDLSLDVNVGALDDHVHLDALFLPFGGSGFGLVDHLGAPFAAHPAVAEPDGKTFRQRNPREK